MQSKITELIEIEWKSLKWFQGELKTITNSNKEKIKESLRKNGFIQPFFVWKDDSDYWILDGHHRLMVLKELDKEISIPAKLPAILVNAETKEQAAKLVLVYSSSYAEITSSGLEEFIKNFELNFNITDEIKIPNLNIDKIINEIRSKELNEEELNELPEPPKIPISKLGDIYLLNGKHRVMCGDSTNAENVALLMNGKNAELLFTSPPYSDMRTYNGNKNLEVSNIIEFINTYSIYSNYLIINLGIQRKYHEINEYWQDYINRAKLMGYIFLSWNVWAKSSAGSIGNQSAFFPIVHEWLFVFGKKFKHINRTVERIKEVNENRIRKVRQKDGSMKMSSIGKSEYYKEMVSVFYSNAENGNIRAEHPATFPVNLPISFIEAMTNINDYIIDSFLGSGTTLIASEQTNRICYGMELDPIYIDVIIKRYHKLYPAHEIKCLNRNVEIERIIA